MIDLPLFVYLIWLLFASGVIVVLATIPMAAWRSGPVAWAVHCAVAIGLGLGHAAVMWGEVFEFRLPWWRPVLTGLLVLTAPIMAAAFVARSAAARWPRHQWAAPSVGVVLTVLVLWKVDTKLVPRLLPEVDMINAVQ